MTRTRLRLLALLTVPLAIAAGLPACSCDDTPPVDGAILGDGFASVIAKDSKTVEVTFSRALDGNTVKPAAFAIKDFTVLPPAAVDVDSATLADRTVTLATGALTPGTRYTLVVTGIKDSAGRTISGTLNFTGVGASGDVADVTIAIADVETARLHTGLVALATLDESGAFSEQLVAYPVTDEGARFAVTLRAAVDPSRTLDRGDDADPDIDRRPYAVLLMDDAGRLASVLVPFVVPDATPRTVDVDVLAPLEIVDPPDTDPLPAPPTDDNPADGVRQVRVVVDDRASRELVAPELKVAFGADGTFDASFPRTVALSPMTGADEGYWQAIVGVKVDPARVADGSTQDTFPYFAFLIEQATPYEALDVAITAPDETPVTVRLSLGNAEWTPVTFRVDASRAYLNASGSQRGVFPDEAVFLTGEWQQASDALGNNCGDAFTGGENGCLEMRPLAGHDGVWTRTLWLPPGRPYGWKVVRCTAGYGCGDLNNLVSSSGRAFATVMKNLATDNVDAFADPNVGIVDPVAPQATPVAGMTRDYSSATVYLGQGIGSEPDPSGTPDGARMFKQEVPDLVVVVAAQPIKTRVISVGTWRDVNLGHTPQEIVDQQLSVELGPSDYDDGFIGRFPPSREEP